MNERDGEFKKASKALVTESRQYRSDFAPCPSISLPSKRKRAGGGFDWED